MSEFCTKCVEKESEYEILKMAHYEEIKRLNKKIQELENQVDSLSLDLAFMDGRITNTGCNGK